ncbi:hypothetical protein HDU81_007761, partial [Chytriomyces hyalinus]
SGIFFALKSLTVATTSARQSITPRTTRNPTTKNTMSRMGTRSQSLPNTSTRRRRKMSNPQPNQTGNLQLQQTKDTSQTFCR